MRKVLSPEMVAHLWANKAQDEARNAGETFYFTGPTIYSYGSHFVIAHHLDNGVVLWNDAGYSNTTSRHKSHAWRALSSAQRLNHLSVNGMNSDSVRDLERCRTMESAAGITPKLVETCIRTVVEQISSIAGMRSIDKMQTALRSARHAEKTGKALCEYVKQGRKMPKWPLPALPETLPEDKAERETFVRSIAKSSLMKKSNDALREFKTRFDSIKADIENPDIAGYTAQNLYGALNSCAARLDEAAKAYAVANSGKILPRFKVYSKEIAQNLERAKHVAQAAKIRETLAGLKSAAKVLALHAPSRKKWTVSEQAINSPLKYRHQYVSRNMAGMREAFDTYAPSVPNIAAYAWLVERAERIAAWGDAEISFKNAQTQTATARSYADSSTRLIASQGRDTSGLWHDATGEYKRVLRELVHVKACANFAALHADAVAEIETEARNYVEQAQARAQAEQAAIISEWKAGISNTRPSFDAGTFARINGDTVETSRGAVVPLAHACRLARIARRLIGHGGKTWTDGAGPQVGHFRVSSIFDDGSAVIGCHEFDAVESLRILALLDACPACSVAQSEAV